MGWMPILKPILLFQKREGHLGWSLEKLVFVNLIDIVSGACLLVLMGVIGIRQEFEDLYL